MKSDRFVLYAALGISFFTGFIIVSIAIGAIFPSLHKLAAPLICRGEVQVESIRYSYKPGQVGWDNHIYCSTDGVKKEITLPAIGVTGLAASAILFAVLAFLWRDSLVVPVAADAPSTPTQKKHSTQGAPKKNKRGTPLERLAELKQMREQNLVSESEYDRKKSEIMEEL
jgi:hypothetical protein